MGDEYIIHVFFVSEIAGGAWSASCTDNVNPRERAIGTNWAGGY
jgi:hypothetical protein